MQSGINPNLGNLQPVNNQKPAQSFIKEPVKQAQAETHSAVRWVIENDKQGNLKVRALPNTTQVDVTTVTIHQEEVAAPRILRFFGYKIDLNAKVEQFKESYVKNFALSRSHNLMVARFAGLKVGFLGFMLTVLGVNSEDLIRLQREAVDASLKQNKILFEENEYNSELLAIVGGGGRKQVRAQNRVIGEIRKQLVTQAKNLGLKDYYTKERVIEIQFSQCQKILIKFKEEKHNLDYQLNLFGVN